MSEEREKIKLIGFGTEIESKKIFNVGRLILGFSLMAFAILLLSGSISKEDDLKSYYNFWQHLAPKSYGGRDAKDELKAFSQQSFFEFQRFVNIFGIILGSALILADNKYGCLYSLISIAYYALVHVNPLISETHINEQ